MSCLYLVVLAVVSSTCAAGPVVIPANSMLVPFQNLSPKPYEFGYEIADGLGTFQHRREVSDGIRSVKGSYGYVNQAGVRRNVDYVADQDGFRPVIHSNEPGLSGQSSANVLYFV